jgi:hypothetical protein
MNTEYNQLYQPSSDLKYHKNEIKMLLKSYLSLLKESVEKMNNINYVNHFLYFSIIQLCNSGGVCDPQLMLGTFKKFFNNTINISEGIQTICLIDNLIKNFQSHEVSTNSTATEKNQKLSASEEILREDLHLLKSEFKDPISNQQAPKVGRLPRINFELLPHYFIGNPILKVNSIFYRQKLFDCKNQKNHKV